MGKSLDYIKQRALEAEKDICFDDSIEISPLNFLQFKDNQYQFSWDNGSFTLTYDPEAEFEYSISNSSRHDGSLIFVQENVVASLNNILSGKAFKDISENKLNCDYYLTMGDIVIINESDKRFATKEKPWMVERTTVAIPFICRYKERV